MATFLELLTNPKKLEAGLKAVKKEMSEKQYGDLITLATTRGGVDVTRDAGSRVRGETVYSCSKIGVMLTKHFGGVGPMDNMMWIGQLMTNAKGDERWAIRPQVKAAVKALGWI